MEFNRGDVLNTLQTDDSIPTNEELQIVQSLFRENSSGIKTILSGLKEGLLVMGLVFLFFLPPISKWLDKVLPMGKSPYVMLLIKALLIGVIFWLVNHFYLAKKG